MADSIVRLKVESSEYDQKLKRAAEGLTRYADECRKVGGTLEVVEKETLDYVRAIGQMDTTSRTATGKLAEMKKTFTELSVVYKNMTDEEKNSPFGKALATSLDQLKGRIGESKAQLDDINKSINGGGGLTGALDSLSEKFGMSVKSLAGWGTALAAGKAALDVAKDAFFASEETVDEWGRVMDSSKSLYEGFLTALNTGDISGYLSRIDSIVQAARAAYNELDRLGTMKTIQAPQMSAQQTENERMRMMIQTGRYIAPVDGRKASMQNGQLLTPDQITRIEKQLQNGMQKVVTLVGNEVAQTGRAIDAVYNRQAQELGMSLKEFRKGTSSMAEFDKRMAGYDQYQKWRAEHTTIDMQSGRETVARGNPFEQFAKWGTFRVDGDRYNDLVKLIQQRDQQAGQAYSMQSQAYRTMNRAEGVTLRQIMGGSSGGGSGRSGSGGGKGFDIASIAFNPISDESFKFDPSQYAKESGLRPENILGPSDEWEKYKDTITGSIGSIGDSMSNLTQWTEDFDPFQESMDKMNKSAKESKMAFGLAANAVSSLGAAFAGMEDPGVRAAGLVLQSIASIALGFAQAAASPLVTGTGWGWLAFLAAGAAAMATTISTVHQLTGYAEGGIVGGNSFSGDNIYAGNAMVNSGELVLTKAQQGNLASQLQGNGLQNMNIAGRIKGTDIILSIDRSLKLEGKQLLTWG
jgi:hypothetical protein